MLVGDVDGETVTCVRDGNAVSSRVGDSEGEMLLSEEGANDGTLHSPHVNGQFDFTDARELHRHHVFFLLAHSHDCFIPVAIVNRSGLSKQLQRLHKTGQLVTTSSILQPSHSFVLAQAQSFLLSIQETEVM